MSWPLFITQEWVSLVAMSMGDCSSPPQSMYLGPSVPKLEPTHCWEDTIFWGTVHPQPHNPSTRKIADSVGCAPLTPFLLLQEGPIIGWQGPTKGRRLHCGWKWNCHERSKSSKATNKARLVATLKSLQGTAPPQGRVTWRESDRYQSSQTRPGVGRIESFTARSVDYFQWETTCCFPYLSQFTGG